MAPVQAQKTDVTGKWTGTLTRTAPDGRTQSIDFIFNLTQKGKDLTGTAGPSADRQWKIEKGKVDGNNLSFEVQGGGDASSGAPVLKFALAFAEGHLKGSVSAERGDMKFTAKVDATRVK
jgi:hypothetical protein